MYLNKGRIRTQKSGFTKNLCRTHSKELQDNNIKDRTQNARMGSEKRSRYAKLKQNHEK